MQKKFVLCLVHRFRGQVEADGELPLKYYRTIASKLAFVILFEVYNYLTLFIQIHAHNYYFFLQHFIFLIGVVLDKLVPDIPQSVEDEIRREKLLAARISTKSKTVNSPEPPIDESAEMEP